MTQLSEFDEILERRNTHSKKWLYPNELLPSYVKEPPLPMWIADMDFQSPREVIEELHKAVEHGVFGYPHSRSLLNEVVAQWQKQRHGWSVHPEWIVQSHGVVNAIAMAILAFSYPGDSILIQPPVYTPFYMCPSLNGRRLVKAPLQSLNGSYGFDAKAFEAAIEPDTKIFILCNPHNPVGRVWSKDELTIMGEICLRHKVMVIADEIHQDIILTKDISYTPFASINEELANISITCTAPSKTFNLAGLQTSNIIIPNKTLRQELERGFHRLFIDGANTLGVVACEAAYRHGEGWLDRLLEYLRGNREFLNNRLLEMPGVSLYTADALFLGWIDFRGTGLTGDMLHKHLLTKAHVWLDLGLKYGIEGSGFARLNFGCPRAILKEALDRISASLEKL